MHRSRFFLLACALALFFVLSARGEMEPAPSSLAAANCSMDAPPDWHPRDLHAQPGVVTAFGDPDGNRTLMVLTYQFGKTAGAVNDAYAASFDKGMESSGGGKKTSGRFTRVAGFEAYERRGTLTAKGRDLTTLAVSIPTGSGAYLLEALSAQGEAAEDQEIRQAVASFRFLHSPGPPRQPQDAAYRAGYLAGQALFCLLILAVVIWAISRAVSRRTPPFPAGFPGPYPQNGFPPAVNRPPPLPASPNTPPPLPPTP